MSRVLGLVESPAQLLNAVEWAYAEQVDAHLVVLGPPDFTNRLQLHRLIEAVGAAGFRVRWAEVRLGAGRVRALGGLLRLLRAASTVVLGDPYSGISRVLLDLAGNPTLVVVDDGTSTLHYARQWARGERLYRWDQPPPSGWSRLAGRRAERLLGHRSTAVRLFTAMPVTEDLPLTRNTYAWTRSAFGPPELLDGVDLLGSSLVETGAVDPAAYLAAVARLVADGGVRRYLPHRREQPAKLAAIRALGVDLVRPDLPLEIHARRGPISRELWSFPSTVLHTLPLVLEDSQIRVRPLAIQDDWFTADDNSRRFVRGIIPGQVTGFLAG